MRNSHLAYEPLVRNMSIAQQTEESGKTLRVLHVLNSLDPRSGGPVAVVGGVLAEQVRLGYDCDVVATDAQATRPYMPRSEHLQRVTTTLPFSLCRLHLARSWLRVRPFGRYSFSPGAVPILRQLIQPPACDIVHVHGVFGHIGIVACRIACRQGVPYIVEPYGQLDAHCMRSGFSFLKRLLYRVQVRDALDHASAIQVASPFERHQTLDHRLGPPVHEIPHGVCLPQGDLAELGKRFLEAHPELAGRRLLLFLSRLHEKKRPGWMLDALAALGSEFADVAVVFVGPDGGQRAQLEERAKALGLGHRAFHVDFLTGDDKVGAFAAAEMFCLPSQDENFGVAVIEAMAHGVPVVVTPGVASHVYVDAAECGLTVGNSVESLAQGIRQILQSDRAELGRRGRQYVEEHLTWPAIAEQIDQLYRGILNGSRR